MDVIASDPAREMIRQQGGRLYVWLKRGRCCGSVTTLANATEPPADKNFRSIEAGDFEVYLPADFERLPDELHLDMCRFPRRIEAHWNGCAWVV